MLKLYIGRNAGRTVCLTLPASYEEVDKALAEFGDARPEAPVLVQEAQTPVPQLFGKVPVWCVAERKQQPVDKTAEQEEAMALQKPMPGTARRRRADWVRGRGPDSMRGELKRGISLRRKQLNKKVRHGTKEALRHAEYKRVVKTLYEVDFT